jgi:hypothetical protein
MLSESKSGVLPHPICFFTVNLCLQCNAQGRAAKYLLPTATFATTAATAAITTTATTGATRTAARSATAATAATRTTFFAWASFIYLQGATFYFLAIQSGNRGGCFFAAGHFNEAETTGLASELIFDHGRGGNLAVSSESRSQLIFAQIERKIPNIDIHSLTPENIKKVGDIPPYRPDKFRQSNLE